MTKKHPLHLLEKWVLCSLNCSLLSDGKCIPMKPEEKWDNAQVLGKLFATFAVQSQTIPIQRISIYMTEFIIFHGLYLYVCHHDGQEISPEQM